MKRIIAAALSILVGAFGYTIVDQAMEDRVTTLESEVVELRGEVSKYHTKYETSFDDTTTSTRPFTIPSNTYYSTTRKYTTTTKLYQPTTSLETVGYTLKEDQESKSKFLLRKYSSGKVVYIAPENLNNPNIITTAPSDSSPMPYEEYFLSVSNSSFVVTDIHKEVSCSYWYDKDYNLLSSPQTKTFYDLEIRCKGYTDPALSGYNINFGFTVYVPQGSDLYYSSLSSRDIHKKTIISNKINPDGSFEYICIVTFNKNVQEKFRCSLNNIDVDNPELYSTTTTTQYTTEHIPTTSAY